MPIGLSHWFLMVVCIYHWFSMYNFDISRFENRLQWFFLPKILLLFLFLGCKTTVIGSCMLFKSNKFLAAVFNKLTLNHNSSFCTKRASKRDTAHIISNSLYEKANINKSSKDNNRLNEKANPIKQVLRPTSINLFAEQFVWTSPD